jgi:hypothetical protein
MVTYTSICKKCAHFYIGFENLTICKYKHKKEKNVV